MRLKKVTSPPLIEQKKPPPSELSAPPLSPTTVGAKTKSTLEWHSVALKPINIVASSVDASSPQQQRTLSKFLKNVNLRNRPLSRSSVVSTTDCGSNIFRRSSNFGVRTSLNQSSLGGRKAKEPWMLTSDEIIAVATKRVRSH